MWNKVPFRGQFITNNLIRFMDPHKDLDGDAVSSWIDKLTVTFHLGVELDDVIFSRKSFESTSSISIKHCLAS